MSDSNPGPANALSADDDNSALVDELARRQFESDWNPRKLNEIESYLPEPDDEKYWATLEELLYIDLEFSWKAYEQVPEDETVSVNQSPTIRLKSISDRLKLDRNRDLLQRLWDYEQSLRDKSRKRRSEQAAGSFDQTQRVAVGEQAPDANGKGPPQVFGNYRLIEPLGRGGMGVVYRAVEQKTERHVALKMIRSNMVARVDEETRRIIMDRFQKEAKAVAQIEHPNIVTLFDVGTHDQTPYLSMQLVDGEDLASRIRTSVLDGKTAARYIRDVAQAIDAAHTKGIIHRDLKPHNILLDKARDVPLVTDFGLAKLTDDRDGLTETGELLGTPGYMSPEQATGSKVDHSTDIYSLGATLYCLVGGRPPFQAADTIKTIEQIVKNPPIEPREVNPDVDADINTICLKCLEKDPSRRYESARELADDLDRYLKGEPILARPIGSLERSVRWCKRNPLPTTIGVSLILLIVVACIGFFRSEGFRKQANQNAAKNQANADLAFLSNKKELFLVTEDRSLKQPGMLATRESLLLPLKDFFQEFIEINQDYANVEIEYAFAHFALGKILHELQDSELAIDCLTRAISMQSEIKKQNPTDQRAIMDLSNSLNLRGECLLKLGITGDSITDYESAFELRLKLSEMHPESLEYRRKLANTLMNLGNWWAYQGEREAEIQAIENYERSNEIREKVLESIVGTTGSLLFNTRYDQAKCLFNLALSHYNQGGMKKSLACAQEASTIFKALHKERPTDFFVARDKARCAQLLATVDLERDPGIYYAEVAEGFLHIANLYPEEQKYRWLAVDALTYLGDFTLERANEAKAEGDQVQEQADFEAAKESFSIAWDQIRNSKADTVDQKMYVVNVCLGWIPIHLRDAENEQARKKLALAEKTLNELSGSNHPDLLEKMGRLQLLKSIVSKLSGPDL